MPKIKLKKPETKMVVKYENSIKNPANALNVNEVRNNRYGAVDAPKESLIRKVFPKKVNQEEYNKFYDVKEDSAVVSKKKIDMPTASKRVIAAFSIKKK